eukprot:gene17797-biopygen26764
MGLNLLPVSAVPCHPLKLAKLAQAGDHIAVRTVIERPCTPTKFGQIWHHGIMVDDDRVVQMHPKGNISVVELEEFVAFSLMAANNELIIKMAGVTSSSDPPKVSIDASAVLQYDGDNDAWKSQTRSIAMWATYDPYMQSIKYDAIADIMRTASAKLGAHLQLRAAYNGEPIAPFQIISVWAFNDELVGVAVPLTSDDYLLSDAVIARTSESGFGVASPPKDGLRFMVLPTDISIRMLMSMSLVERQLALVASPHMEVVWRQHVFFDVPSSELYFEVDL